MDANNHGIKDQRGALKPSHCVPCYRRMVDWTGPHVKYGSYTSLVGTPIHWLYTQTIGIFTATDSAIVAAPQEGPAKGATVWHVPTAHPLA